MKTYLIYMLFLFVIAISLTLLGFKEEIIRNFSIIFLLSSILFEITHINNKTK